jgi:hypothetical protein
VRAVNIIFLKVMQECNRPALDGFLSNALKRRNVSATLPFDINMIEACLAENCGLF